VLRRPTMLTGMTEDDWTIVLDVFRAARSSGQVRGVLEK